MTNKEISCIYDQLVELSKEFYYSKSSKGKDLTKELSKRGRIIEKARAIIEGNPEALKILNTFESYGYEERHFFTDQYFDKDLDSYLVEMNKKFKFDGF